MNVICRAAPLIHHTIDGKTVTHIGGFSPHSERVDFRDTNTAKWMTFAEIDAAIAAIETARREAFRASPLLMGFLGTMLQDLQLSEGEEAFQDDREERDVGTIWNCPDATFVAARGICDAFYAAAPVEESDCSSEQLGSDLYLESAGHGAGFSDREHDDDRDVSRDIATRLSAAVVDRVEVYAGDDGAAWIVGRELESVA